ncbi:MAG: hypothetical protein OXP08_08470 [bacterium]|nr:hypothetical protein [bacterium]
MPVITATSHDDTDDTDDTAPTTSNDDVSGTLTNFLQSDIGGIVQSVVQALAVVMVIGVTGSQIYKAVTGGSGITRALPTIGGVLLLGAFMFNLGFVATALEFFIGLLDSIFKSIGTVFGIGEGLAPADD